MDVQGVVVITEDVQNVHLLLEYRPHIDVSLTCEHDPKLQEYCVCRQNMPQFDSEGIPNQAPETNKPMILNGPTSRNREVQIRRSSVLLENISLWNLRNGVILQHIKIHISIDSVFHKKNGPITVSCMRQLCLLTIPQTWKVDSSLNTTFCRYPFSISIFNSMSQAKSYRVDVTSCAEHRG
ncbi:hypothetical protein ANN_09252 [Periplaneta americana]|uniref:Uncharacterized protein n=1 Tax=Periplaneta americana TaxID=6978 RepID=A0ABQ8TLS1_PERAM|nr:hypothetical protein ANN_09252 [Periplaneta americana]